MPFFVYASIQYLLSVHVSWVCPLYSNSLFVKMTVTVAGWCIDPEIDIMMMMMMMMMMLL